jgi:hypothetical protein
MNASIRRASDAPDDNHEKQRGVPLERHIQTAIGAVLIGLVFWVGSTLSGAQTQMAVLEAKVSLLTTEVTKLRSKVEVGVEDRYRGEDARRDFAEVWEAIEKLKADHYRIIPQP